uniref:Calmodulin-like n=1 Tax=Saccoglossus kowalevskii TaxID=10224 RepID=A0ABM0GWH2_SACKO|nr:PREDICTED: calmodulin-like [Saccoglossus kowalevskii]
MPDHLTEEQISELWMAFSLSDKNGDGLITMNELKSIMQSVDEYMTEAQFKDIVSVIGSDAEDISLHFLQFLIIMTRQLNYSDSGEEIKAAFRLFDKDGNGYITASEIRRLLRRCDNNLGEEEVEELIRAADINGDGQIDYDEFLKIVLAK